MATKKLLGMITLVLAVAAWPVWYFTHPDVQPMYETALVEQGNLQSIITASGSVNPLLTVGVGAQISGVVTKLYVDYESKVHKGQLLAEIDPRPLQVALKMAQADVDTARGAVAAAEAQVRVATSGISAAKDDVGRYKALSREFASVEQHYEVEVNRQQGLGPIASADDLASAKATRDMAADDATGASAQEQISELNVDEKTAEYDQATAQLESAKGQLSQAQAAFKQAQVNLERTRILAPIDGTILVVDVAVGQTVAASMQVPELFQIAEDLSKMQVDVNIDESDVGRVQLGDRAMFSVDAFPGKTFDASVRQIRKNSTNVNNVISYDVVLEVPKTPVQLLPGMTANIQILSAERNNVVKVPNGALRFRAPAAKTASKERSVYVRNARGQAEERKITIGLADARQTEVVTGNLHPGESVIIAETLK